MSKEEGICTLTINRPEKRNALTPEVFSRLIEALQSASEDGQTSVVVIRGAGEQAFSAGYEISRLNNSKDFENNDPMEG